MTGTMEVSREIAGQAIVNGATQEQALLAAGYSPKTARYNSTAVLRTLNISDWLEDWKEANARAQLESLTRGNLSGEILTKTRSVIDEIEDPAKRAKLMLEYAKITTGRSQDLLDRAGIGKISKSLRITSKVDIKSLEDVQGRIQALRDKIEAQPGPKKAKGRSDKTANRAIIDGVRTGDNAYTASICQSVPANTTINDFDGKAQGQDEAIQASTAGDHVCQCAHQGPVPENVGGGGQGRSIIPPHIDAPDLEVGPSISDSYEI